MPRRIPRRIMHWWQDDAAGFAEIVMVTLLIISAIALHRLTETQIRMFGTYRQMNAILPIIWWEILVLVLAFGIMLGTFIRRPFISALGFLGAAVLFIAIGIIIWRVSDTLLSPALYIAFAVGSAKRTGELLYRLGGGNVWKRY
jgi:uncharacterized membrane protein